MLGYKRIVLILFLVVGLASSVYGIDCGSVISTDFLLDGDMYCEDGNGLIAGSDNITIDCNGHIIRGGYDLGYIARAIITGKRNVKIKNCMIENYYTGIDAQNGAYDLVMHNVYLKNNRVGIALALGMFAESYDVNITNSLFEANSLLGILNSWTEGNISVIGNTFINDSIYENSQLDPRWTIYYNNFIDSIVDIPSYYNVIMDDGSIGNYWSNYDEVGEGCEDLDSDGICDSPYGRDNYPLTNMLDVALCYNGVRDIGEGGVDCGGVCPACPTCDDGVENGFEEGIDCGWACNSVCDECESIINNGDSENKIDVAFIGSGFDNYSQLRDVIDDMVDYNSLGYGLMSVAPFNTSKDKFNFWMVRSLENFTLDNFRKKTKSIANDACLHADQVVLLSITPRYRSFSSGTTFWGIGGKYAYVTIGCEFVGKCDYPLVVADIHHGQDPDECQGDANYLDVFLKKCSDTATNDPTVIRTFLHEFGHIFGGLDDEYEPSTIGPKPPTEIPNCDIEGCSKWSDVTDGCYKGCHYSDWYRAYENTIMRYTWELEDDFKQVNINELQKDILSKAPDMAEILSSLTAASQQEQNLSYSLDINYSYGNLSLIDLKLVSGKASKKEEVSDYVINTVSFEDEILDSFNYTFDIREIPIAVMSWFDNETLEQVYIPNESDIILNETVVALALKYFSNAELIDIYRNDSLILTVNVSEYHDLDNDKIIAVVDNCPYDYNPSQEDADNDGVGDVCDYIAVNISLNQGWNLVSIPLNLTNKSVDSVFVDADIYGYNDSWFVPEEIDNRLGYWLKVNENRNLTLMGIEIDNITVELNEGWNLIGYPPLNAILINDSLNDINYSVVYGYNGSWLSYVPLREANSLDYFIPGYGYWVNSKENVVLSFD